MLPGGRGRYTSKNSEARVELFTGSGRGVAMGSASTYPSATGGRGGGGGASSSNLPEIDQETQDGLQVLEKKNVAIDEQVRLLLLHPHAPVTLSHLRWRMRTCPPSISPSLTSSHILSPPLTRHACGRHVCGRVVSS